MTKLVKILLQDDEQQQQEEPAPETNDQQIEEETEEPQPAPEQDESDMTWLDSNWIDKNGNTYTAFNMQGMLFWNYYITYISLFNHIVIHVVFLGLWCSYSKIVLFYSFQICLMHAYSWAIPDRRYAKWVETKRNWFYMMSGANIIFFLCGIFGGAYLYNYSRDGMLQFMGVSFICYTVFS